MQCWSEDCDMQFSQISLGCFASLKSAKSDTIGQTSDETCYTAIENNFPCPFICYSSYPLTTYTDRNCFFYHKCGLQIHDVASKRQIILMIRTRIALSKRHRTGAQRCIEGPYVMRKMARLCRHHLFRMFKILQQNTVSHFCNLHS